MVQLYGNSRNLVPIDMGADSRTDRSLMVYFILQVSLLRIIMTAPQCFLLLPGHALHASAKAVTSPHLTSPHLTSPHPPLSMCQHTYKHMVHARSGTV